MKTTLTGLLADAREIVGGGLPGLSLVLWRLRQGRPEDRAALRALEGLMRASASGGSRRARGRPARGPDER